MTRLEERCLGLVAREHGGEGALGYLKRLAEEGLLDRKGCEREAVRVRMAELESGGRMRCEAMEIAAREFCCSYEKIRKLFYEARRRRQV